MGSVTTDGRAARSQRTRDSVIDALVALIRDGDLDPTAPQIAERADVSTRSVFVHFASLEDLHAAVAERMTAFVLGLLTPIDPDSPLDDRVESVCSQRATVNEELTPFRRASARREATSPVLARQREFARRASREQVERIFAAELAGGEPAGRRRLVAGLDSLLSGESWDLLRQTHGLSVHEARRSMTESVRALLLSRTARTGD